MKVLLSTPYDLAVPGGVNRHALGLFDALSQRGLDVRLVGPSSSATSHEDPRIIPLGTITVGSLNGAKSRVTLDLGIERKVRRLMASFGPTIVHVQEPFLPTLNTFVLLHADGARRVGTFHTYSATSRGYLWAWPWCAWINRHLDARIAVSAAAAAFVNRYHRVPTTLVPHGAPPVADGDKRTPRPPGHPVNLLFVGRADEPRKGFATLSTAMSLLHRRRPGGFSLEALGRGTPAGEASEGDLNQAFRRADICVLPSVGGESFGLVALEALSRGVPVVASRIVGYAEWLDGSEAARLVEPEDPEALCEAIIGLAEPDIHASAARASLGLAERYTWDRCVEATIRIYEGQGA